MARMERVTGIGGVFLRARDSEHLRSWYAEHLGIEAYPTYEEGPTTWAVFDADSDYFGRPDQAFMVNYRVADLDAMLGQLQAAGVETGTAEASEHGRFTWAVDPEGNRFELWEPPAS